MKVDERKTAREKLEAKLELFRKAARKAPMQPAFLRQLRQALGIPVSELAHRLKVSRASVYRAEQDEATGCLTLGDLDEVAHAMGCKVVYGLVPYRDESLDALSADLKKYPQRDTPQIVTRKAKGTRKTWDDLQAWRMKRLWEDAADKQAARVRKEILERAKAYGWSVEAAEKAEAEKEKGNGPLRTGAGTEDAAEDTPEWEEDYPPVPRTAEEMRRMGVGGAEAIRAALAERLRRA